LRLVIDGALIERCNGDLYGTTEFGGTSGKGTVFKISRSGDETVLHSFGSTINDGTYPIAPLILGSDGRIYGTTASGGGYGNGMIFQISTAGVETVLYSFTYGVKGSTDGAGPSGLMEGGDGDLYGTTGGGGVFGFGTVFKMTNVIEHRSTPHGDAEQIDAGQPVALRSQRPTGKCNDLRGFN
jgi:uncharacterized repeat protein (TIGR03803 family)